MKKLLAAVLCLALPAAGGLARVAARTPGSVTAVDLRCEYMAEPSGLDIERPRFGWRLETVDADGYGQNQTAYRIEVRDGNAGGPGKVIWDTGWIASSSTRNIAYGGPALLSDRTYRWRVMVRDGSGSESPWSGYASWSTGLFRPGDWMSRWIGTDRVYDKTALAPNDMPDPWFRKTVSLAGKPARAVMFVASIGYHEIYVNGAKVGDEVLAPNVSDHTTRARYLAYDITDLLRPGDNMIGIWLGVSWSIFRPYFTDDKPAAPMVNAQCAVYYDRKSLAADRPDVVIATDDSWETSPSPNMLTGRWGMGAMGGEIWDARQVSCESPEEYFTGSEWKNVTVYNPDLILSAQRSEGNRKFDELSAISVNRTPGGDYRADMGRNFSGMVEIEVEGQPGDTVEFLFSEREQEAVTFGIRSAYIIGPSGKGIFRNRFNYSVGRWITVRGLKYEPTPAAFKGYMVRTAFDRAAEFECSNDLHNWVYNTVLWTFENLSLGGFVVDCPHRERLGYGGDAHATSETGMFNYDLAAFYAKWLEDWRDVQGQESNMGPRVGGGRLPHTAPTNNGGGGPSWGGISVMLPWYMYLHYGDQKVLEENYGMMKGWLEWLGSHVKDGLLCRFGGPWDFLADWLWPGATAEGMNNDKPAAVCFNSCYMVLNLSTAARIAELLGDRQQAEAWRAQAEVMRKAVHEAFFDPLDNSYCDRSMGNLTMALITGVPPGELKDKVFQRLEHEIRVVRDGHIHVGITGGAMLFKLLRDAGRDDLIHMMTTREGYPGWEYMRADGATTIWEMWEKDLPGHSLLHSSFLFPGVWYIEGIAGIKRDPAAPGFDKFIIRAPDLPEGEVSYARCSFDSPAGLIRSNWERKDGLLTHRVTVPPNTLAKVYMPSTAGTRVREESGHARLTDREAEYVIFEAPAGNYIFIQEKY